MSTANQNDFSVGSAIKPFFIIILIVWAANSVLALIGYHYGILEKMGQFGDFFGSLNAFFSALAFCAVFVTLLQQLKENAESKQEFIQTLIELKESKQAQQDLAKATQNSAIAMHALAHATMIRLSYDSSIKSLELESGKGKNTSQRYAEKAQKEMDGLKETLKESFPDCYCDIYKECKSPEE